MGVQFVVEVLETVVLGINFSNLKYSEIDNNTLSCERSDPEEREKILGNSESLKQWILDVGKFVQIYYNENRHRNLI